MSRKPSKSAVAPLVPGHGEDGQRKHRDADVRTAEPTDPRRANATMIRITSYFFPSACRPPSALARLFSSLFFSVLVVPGGADDLG